MSQEEQQLSPQERHLEELGQAARRAGTIVTEQINTIVTTAERQAEDITHSAEREAEMARREAHESARRVLERIGALERPLGDLVMTLRHEMDRLQGELEGRGPEVTSHAVEAPAPDRAISAPEPEAAPPAREQEAPDQAEEPAQEPRAEEPEPAETTGREPPPAEPARKEPPPAEPAQREPRGAPPIAEPAQEKAPSEAASPADTGGAQPGAEPPLASPSAGTAPRGRVRGVFGRLKSKGPGGDVFITTPGYCAVCQRSFAAGTPENLARSGWLVSGDVGVCPECQSEGWQLPQGARLPFRSGSG